MWLFMIAADLHYYDYDDYLQLHTLYLCISECIIYYFGLIANQINSKV